MDNRLLKKYRKIAKSAIKLVPYSDGSIAIECGKYEWHRSEYSKCGYSWKRQKDVFISTTFRSKAESQEQYDNAVRDLVCDYASRERGRRKAEQTLKEMQS